MPNHYAASSPTRPPNLAPCPGCGEMIHFKTIACAVCWRDVPGSLKAELTATPTGTDARKRIVVRMRQVLRELATNDYTAEAGQ